MTQDPDEREVAQMTVIEVVQNRLLREGFTINSIALYQECDNLRFHLRADTDYGLLESFIRFADVKADAVGTVNRMLDCLVMEALAVV